ncbi:hypothetical protein BC829DRAFT_379299 [Chytridium lagenaria]|nr:hypothetical protein BC829DRAFT_379299 [Chytridium lagenaria]
MGCCSGYECGELFKRFSQPIRHVGDQHETMDTAVHHLDAMFGVAISLDASPGDSSMLDSSSPPSFTFDLPASPTLLADGTPSPHPKLETGFGLGLLISKQLVESMGGRGSKFYFVLGGGDSKLEGASGLDGVMRSGQAVEGVVSPKGMWNEEVKYRIPRGALVVDDNPINQRPSPSSSPLLQHPLPPIDIVFMDVEMPRMDGITATNEIRALEKRMDARRPVVVVGLSGNAREVEGMDGFIVKPFRGEDILAVCRLPIV